MCSQSVFSYLLLKYWIHINTMVEDINIGRGWKCSLARTTNKPENHPIKEHSMYIWLCQIITSYIVQFFHSNFWMLKKKNKSKLRTDIISSLYAPLTLRRLWTPIPLQVIIAWMIILFKPSVIAWWSDVLIAEGLLSLFIYLHFSNTAYLNNGTFSTFQGIHFNSAS